MSGRVCTYMVYKYYSGISGEEGRGKAGKHGKQEPRDGGPERRFNAHASWTEGRKRERKKGSTQRGRYHNEWIIKPSRPVPFRSSTFVVSRSAARSPHPRAVAWLGNSFRQTTQPLFVDSWGVGSENLRRNLSRLLNLLLPS